MLPLVEIDSAHDAIVSLLSGRLSACGVRFLAIFAQKLAFYNTNNRVLLSQALCVIGSLGNFDVQASYKPSNYVLRLIFIVNSKFPRATYHMIVPSTE